MEPNSSDSLTHYPQAIQPKLEWMILGTIGMNGTIPRLTLFCPLTKNIFLKNQIYKSAALSSLLWLFICLALFIRPPGNEGEWQAWGGWSQCTSSCGEGLRVRARGCSGSGGGSGSEETCPGDSTETEGCISAECLGIVNTQWWSPFLMVFFNNKI